MSPTAASSLVIRAGVYEEVEKIKAVAKTHKYTKHFSHPAYCNRSRFEAGQVIVAVIGDEIVGFCSVGIKTSKHETEIDIIGVDEGRRGYGIGAALIDYLIDHQPNPVIMLSVQTDNTRAIQFYERYGFKRRHTMMVAGTPVFRMRLVCKKGVLY